MIKGRINHFMDEYEVLPANSCAYFAGKSASSCINDILLYISITKRRSQQVLALVLDVKNEYAKVDLATLCGIMSCFRFPAEVVLWVSGIMSNRRLQLWWTAFKLAIAPPKDMF